MDLGAYANIKDLDEIVKANGIDCPRLRGYRLMANEEPIDYRKMLKWVEELAIKDACYTHWNQSEGWELSIYTDRILARHYDERGERIKWENIHGKKRKMLKTAIHNRMNRYKKQYAMWNKYAGRKDILYIHARIGGGNWHTYYKDVVDQPWYIEKVDDAFDSTYCDIYARIKEGGI